MSTRLVAIVVLLFAVTACGVGDDSSASDGAVDQTSAAAEQFPDVVDVELTDSGEGDFEVAVTLSSPYDSPDRYADAWRVLDPEGNELGVHELTHDHASEQPFTRQTTVSIPGDVGEITVEGRDQISGYGGETVTVAVPR